MCKPVIINNVRIFVNPQADESSLKATATMLVNNQLLLQSIRIFQDEAKTSDGDPVFRIVYPVQRVNSDDLRHCMYPLRKPAISSMPQFWKHTIRSCLERRIRTPSFSLRTQSEPITKSPALPSIPLAGSRRQGRRLGWSLMASFGCGASI